MADGDAQAQQPDPERGVGIARPVAPRRAVVEHHAPRQAVTLERGHQAGLDRGPALVRAGLQTEREARMVIEQGERMAAPGVVGEVSLEVHLPEFVGPVPLEADHRVRREQLALVQAPVAAQNRGDRRGRRDPGRAQVTKPARQLAPAPTRVRTAQRHHLRLNLGRRTSRARTRPARAVGEAFLGIQSRASQPLITRLRTDPVAAAQCPYVRSLLARQHHKLRSKRHDRPLCPRHGTAPNSNADPCPILSTMSPYTCHPSPRSIQWGRTGVGVTRGGALTRRRCHDRRGTPPGPLPRWRGEELGWRRG